MTRTSTRLLAPAAALAAAASLTAPGASAQTTFSGPFVGDTVTYSDVQDQDDLFGAPTLTRDTLNFTPQGFNAESIGGGIDFVDGFLSTLIETNDGDTGITEFTLEESGAFSLESIGDGFGTGNTRVEVAVIFNVNVLEVDGSAVSVPFLTSRETLLTANLVDDDGLGQAWTASTTIDIAALAAEEGITGDITRVRLTLDNQLLAVSEDGTVAFVDKKGVRAVSITVPEPTSALLVLGGGALLLRRRFAA